MTGGKYNKRVEEEVDIIRISVRKDYDNNNNNMYVVYCKKIKIKKKLKRYRPFLYEKKKQVSIIK